MPGSRIDYREHGYYCMPKPIFTPIDVAEQLELQGADKDTIYWAILDEKERRDWDYCTEAWAEDVAHYAMSLRHDRTELPIGYLTGRERAVNLAALGATVEEIVRMLYADDRLHMGRNTYVAMLRAARSAVAQVKQKRDWDILNRPSYADFQVCETVSDLAAVCRLFDVGIAVAACGDKLQFSCKIDPEGDMWQVLLANKPGLLAWLAGRCDRPIASEDL